MEEANLVEEALYRNAYIVDKWLYTLPLIQVIFL